MTNPADEIAVAIHNAQVLENFRTCFEMLHEMDAEHRAHLIELCTVASQVSRSVHGVVAPGLAELKGYVEDLQKKEAN